MILLRGLLSEFSYLVAEVHTSSTVSEISHFLQLVLRATLRSHQVTSHHLEKGIKNKKIQHWCQHQMFYGKMCTFY